MADESKSTSDKIRRAAAAGTHAKTAREAYETRKRIRVRTRRRR